MSDFKKFSQAVHAQFEKIKQHELYTTQIDQDLFDVYLKAFPEGTNPIFRERTEHDCSCCKSFIRNLGRVVAIIDGKLVSVWDDANLEAPYDQVAQVLAGYVKSFPIAGIYRTKERSYGAETSKEQRTNDEGIYVHTWNHFHGKVADKHFSTSPDQARGDFGSVAGVFKRGLEELKPEAFTDVLDLINSNSLYRGTEHLAALSAFRKLQAEYSKVENKEAFVWQHANHPAARFRNTVIGTLITDLSDGVELEKAVKSFEQKVAPENYKRPSALITPRMVEDAMKTINELGLEPALERRLATLEDISVNDVLWVDNGVAAKMKGGLHNMLMGEATQVAQASGKAQDIPVGEFIAGVAPKAKSIDLLVRNTHQPNFMTMTTAVHADAPQLFKWGSPIAWSYDGNMTDSIKERVKAAGGNVTAPLRFSLGWTNYDDLDIHVFTPKGNRIYFGNRGQIIDGGTLDVDMNAGGRRQSRTPVENVTFQRPPNGEYQIKVNNYIRVETIDQGFTIEIENNGAVSQYSTPKSPATSETVLAATVQVKGGVITELTLGKGLTGGGVSTEKWGIKTETFVKVQTILKSPNHWNGAEKGNLHTFFILEGCKTEDSVRGVYNEFLQPELEKHRKVFETIGNRTKCSPSSEQLSGLGFSSTRSDSVTVRVDGGKQYNIIF